jgi:hypothetical protein
MPARLRRWWQICNSDRKQTKALLPGSKSDPERVQQQLPDTPGSGVCAFHRPLTTPIALPGVRVAGAPLCWNDGRLRLESARGSQPFHRRGPDRP